MQKEISFISIGQAGGNIGKLLEERGFNVVFINSAKEDLDTLTTTKKYHIANGEGCNKDRSKAKELLKADGKGVLEFIESNVKENFVVLIGSAGGGTGSGCLPTLAKILTTSTNKKVGIITVLPSENESIQAHINTFETFQEIAKIEDLGSIFLIDNNVKNGIIDINNIFVSLFVSLLNVREHNSIKGNIDKAELKEFLSSKGCTVIAKDKGKVDKDFNIYELLKSENNNVFAPIEQDKVLKYVLYSGKNLEKNKIIGLYGVPKDYYMNQNKNMELVAISGLTIPLKRFENIKNSVLENKEVVEKNMEAVNSMFDIFGDDNISFNTTIKESKSKEKKNKEFNLDADMFSAFL